MIKTIVLQLITSKQKMIIEIETEMITDLVLQMGHASPVLTVQWIYILVLMDHSSPAVWARGLGISRGPANSRLSATEQSEPAASLGLEVARKAAIAVMGNHLV